MNHSAGLTSDHLVLVDQRSLVVPVEHVIDALACHRAGKGGVTFHLVIIAADRREQLRYLKQTLQLR